MAEFSISVSIQVEANDYNEAYELETVLTQHLLSRPEVMNVFSIDVEQTDGFEDEDDNS
jgi:hypothetical protein